jgi:ABC-2 type transport system permease protein
MVAYAAQHDALWPHLVALVWQLIWIVLIIRVSARLFRLTVLKSSSGSGFLNLRLLFRPNQH